MTISVVTESTADYRGLKPAQNPLAAHYQIKDQAAPSPARHNSRLNPAVTNADNDERCYLLGYH